MKYLKACSDSLDGFLGIVVGHADFDLDIILVLLDAQVDRGRLLAQFQLVSRVIQHSSDDGNFFGTTAAKKEREGIRKKHSNNFLIVLTRTFQ